MRRHFYGVAYLHSQASKKPAKLVRRCGILLRDIIEGFEIQSYLACLYLRIISAI